jgi:hypothetical protein
MVRHHHLILVRAFDTHGSLRSFWDRLQRKRMWLWWRRMYSGLQLHEFYSEPMPRYLVGRLPDFDFELLQLQELVLRMRRRLALVVLVVLVVLVIVAGDHLASLVIQILLPGRQRSFIRQRLAWVCVRL